MALENKIADGKTCAHKKFSKNAMKVWGEFLDLIFPRECANCGAINPIGGLQTLCKECAKSVFIVKSSYCSRCAEVFGNRVDGEILDSCPKCFENPPHFAKSRTACLFAGSSKELVENLKYRGKTASAADMAKIALSVPDLKNFFDGAILVPVPLHWRRLSKRGFNQAEIISRHLLKNFPDCGLKIKNLLSRNRNTSTQTVLEKSEREKNIRGAFALSRNAEKISKNSRLILVDDVMTTTSTMSECARTLKRAGFKNVDAFAFARRL